MLWTLELLLIRVSFTQMLFCMRAGWGSNLSLIWNLKSHFLVAPRAGSWHLNDFTRSGGRNKSISETKVEIKSTGLSCFQSYNTIPFILVIPEKIWLAFQFIAMWRVRYAGSKTENPVEFKQIGGGCWLQRNQSRVNVSYKRSLTRLILP